MKAQITAVLLSLLFYGCSFLDNKAILPRATGGAGEIILIMDSTKWAGALGDEIRNIFKAPFPGLIQDEPLFNLVRVDPDKFNSVLRNARNLVFVSTLEGNSRGDIILRNYFTKESQAKILADSNIYYTKQDDLFARDQAVMHLFQRNSDLLIDHLVANRTIIQNYFVNVQKSRYRKALYQAPREQGIENKLLENHQFFLQVPYGYEIGIETDHSIWIRLMDNKVDKNLFIAYKDYSEEQAFNREKIIAFRNKAWKQLLLGDDSLSYMITEPLVPIDSISLNLGEKFAVEVRGAWKLKNNSMGGPFLGYVFVDQSIGRLYYVEGFVYSPGKKKRNTLRELETILRTFQTQSEHSS